MESGVPILTEHLHSQLLMCFLSGEVIFVQTLARANARAFLTRKQDSCCQLRLPRAGAFSNPPQYSGGNTLVPEVS